MEKKLSLIKKGTLLKIGILKKIEEITPLNKNDVELIRNTEKLTKLPLITMVDGATYEGEWLNGLRHGFGKYVY